ncbi:ribbon-helix-helix protein, CopG family [Corynebacterium macginleyi]|uniref:type II toxin-antitoxin system RelB family antitoxin n=1 Tax=Corynebacterium macginleyi TaxID=38290 RepID=UPI000EF970CF|nr:ribbon-helix-helix domain-containing protein [Corynebacterium macginleyi]MBM0261392.1 ribbon-helix-helix protein, CopG family [Corynebacterium macginleyi]QRP20801.1 ribbon-helix-helix protein, CopG family [Corynebacterium macginleyi]RMB66258.1 ribbon-helix-helix protein, CopG family [Corynebacterium macginleyi]
MLTGWCTNRFTCCKHVYAGESVISLRVDANQKERLDALASRTGRTGSFYLRKALDSYLDELGYVYALEAEAGAARRGELDTISLQALEDECGLVD